MKGIDFEYIVVDNFSTDGGWEILTKWAENKNNFTCIQKKCTRGRGRQTAVLRSKGEFIVVVDTDTLYFDWFGKFVKDCIEKYPKFAVQSIYSGVYPITIWDEVGGQRSMNIWEDLDLWMRIHDIEKMKWYPVHSGENIKDISDSMDFQSERYGRKGEKIKRLIFGEYNRWQCREWEHIDQEQAWKDNTIDLGYGELQDRWFGRNPRGSIFVQILRILRQTKAVIIS